MKRLILVFSIFVLSACGNSESPTTSATDSGSDNSDTQAPVSTATQVVSAPASETGAVEESSASEARTEDDPIMLAQANTSSSASSRFNEGEHYIRLVPTQPTVGGADKVEVAEAFWYGCNHCFDFEPFIERWLGNKSSDVRFVRIPVVGWNPLTDVHAQLYFTEEVLANNGKIENPQEFHTAVFVEIQRRGNRLASQDAIRSFFQRHGVSAEDFDSTWNSFEVAQKMRVAADLIRRYGISGVPAVVVNGKYRSGAGEAGGYPSLLELVDDLSAKEAGR